MKKTSLRAPLALLACSGLIWAACTKNAATNTPANVSNTTTSAEADASADQAFNGVTANVMALNVNGEALGSVSDSTSAFSQAATKARIAGVTTFGPGGDTSSLSISVSPTTPGVFPKTVTISFGSGFTDLWGNTYTGSISMVFTGPLSVAGNSATTTFTNYSVNGIGLSGTHVITNASTNSQIAFNIQIENAKITLGSFWVTWSANHTWTMTAGASTPHYPFDDTYSVTGQGGGSTSTNFTWTSTIQTALTRAYICPWFEAGTVKVVTNYGTGVLDFGSGTCDNQATVTVGDSTRTVTLSR